MEALQEIRIKYRWQAIVLENEAIEKARKAKKKYDPILLSNDDTIKQLLARSRYSFYIKTSRSGLKTKQNELQYYLNYILTLKKPMI